MSLEYYVAGLFMATLYIVVIIVLALILAGLDWMIRGRR